MTLRKNPVAKGLNYFLREIPTSIEALREEAKAREVELVCLTDLGNNNKKKKRNV